MVTKQEGITLAQNIECTYKTQWYNIWILSLSIFGLVLYVILKSQGLKLCRGHLFSNAVKIMLFIPDTQCYVSINLCRMAGSIHLFKIMGMLTPENVKLKKNLIWDAIELDWKEVNMILNGNNINIPKSITTEFRDKFTLRHIVTREPLIFHIMLKQGLMWFIWLPTTLQKQYNTYKIYFQRKWLTTWHQIVTFSSELMYSAGGHNRY